jgi:hypothetical protein
MAPKGPQLFYRDGLFYGINRFFQGLCVQYKQHKKGRGMLLPQKSTARGIHTPVSNAPLTAGGCAAHRRSPCVCPRNKGILPPHCLHATGTYL